MLHQNVVVTNLNTNSIITVTIRIDAPIVDAELGGSSCSVSLDGLTDGKSVIKGINNLNALANALIFLQSYFSGLPTDNIVTTPDGDEFFIAVNVL